MVVREILDADVCQVVKVHKDSFENFFLSELGDHFLMVYYDSIRKNKKGILLGLFDGGELCGFCAATTLSRGFNTNLIKENFSHFLLIGFRLSITRPVAIVRLFKNLTKKGSKISDQGEYAELLSIATLPEKQGLGIGKKLLFQLEKDLKLKGCNELSLTTDYYNNDKTIQFYKGLGYSVYYDFIAYPNRKMYRLIKRI